MNCLECNQELSYLERRQAIESFGAELCKTHQRRLERLVKIHETPVEAITLYYGLKAAGTQAMLAWWDGKRTIDLAVSRVKLNIEIDRGSGPMTHDQAMNDLEETMHSFKNGFTTIRIPHFLIRHHLKETVANIQGIIEGLRNNLRVV